MNDNSQNSLSNNKAFSDNKVSLFGDFNIDLHLEELALLFFPATRSAMIQTRLLEFAKIQANTIVGILQRAKEIADSQRIQIQTFPAKFGLPVLEKMSLEIDDKEMQEQWAKLLVAAGKDYNPIHIQYVEVLSQLNNESAKLLKDIYDKTIIKEKDDLTAFSFIEFENKDVLFNNNKLSQKSSVEEHYIIMCCIEDQGYAEEHFKSIYKTFHLKPELNTLLLLERLNLIKLSYYTKNNLRSFTAKLTPFGYKFVETLEV